MIDPLRVLGYVLLALFCALASPFVIARAMEVYIGTYDEPTHSGAMPECPATAPCGGFGVASPY